MRISLIPLSCALLMGLISCSADEKTKSIDVSLKVNSFTHSDPSIYQKDGTRFYLRFGDFVSSQKMRKGKTGFGVSGDIPSKQKSVIASACSLPDAIGFKKVDVSSTSVVKESIVIGEAKRAKLDFPNLTNSTYPIRSLADGWKEPEELIINASLNGEDLPIGSVCILHMIPVRGDRNPEHPIQRLDKYFDISHGDLILKTGREGADIWINILNGGNNLEIGKVILMGHSSDDTGNVGFHAESEIRFTR